MIGLLFSFVFTQVALDVNFVEDMNEMVEESMTMSSNLIEQFGLQEQQTEEVEELIQMQMNYLSDLLPAFVIFLLLFWLSLFNGLVINLLIIL
ncbi:DUF2232 domain-containing protein [Oceanobacillus sp. 143]|nr:DUF2232 domain-containing protein [Oceanobacillus sp. 143]